jgi:hypothetical protein
MLNTRWFMQMASEAILLQGNEGHVLNIRQKHSRLSPGTTAGEITLVAVLEMIPWAPGDCKSVLS